MRKSPLKVGWFSSDHETGDLLVAFIFVQDRRMVVNVLVNTWPWNECLWLRVDVDEAFLFVCALWGLDCASPLCFGNGCRRFIWARSRAVNFLDLPGTFSKWFPEISWEKLGLDVVELLEISTLAEWYLARIPFGRVREDFSLCISSKNVGYKNLIILTESSIRLSSSFVTSRGES